MKRCNVCGKEKPVSEFYKHGKYVVQPCKSCSKIAAKLRTEARRKAEEERRRRQAERASKAAADKHKRRTRAKAVEQVCRNCWRYPCFKGIDSMSSNLALTCCSWQPAGGD